MAERGKGIGPALLFGSITGALYLLLFLFEWEILELTGKGGWTFLIPIAVAFALSYTHGNFTAAFWDLLGIKARK